MPSKTRRLVLILEDQLDVHLSALDDFDAARDQIVMAEVAFEMERLPFHKQRLVLILSAMRHFAAELGEAGYPLDYRKLDEVRAPKTYEDLVQDAIRHYRPQEVVVTRPGDFRVLRELEAGCRAHGRSLTLVEDAHFVSTPAEFERWTKGRKSWTLEYFYRMLRKRTGLLMNGKKPTGGTWNLDKENRKSLSEAPGSSDKTSGVPLRPRVFEPDALTQEVMALVSERYADHLGSLESFGWPVTRAQAQAAADYFFEERLPLFGDFQDAMWTGEAFLYHSCLSAPLNLHLLHPRDLLNRAEQAYTSGHAPLNAVEGFVRQILGWREYVRGVYWATMPGYLERNALEAHQPLPSIFWDGATKMRCLSEVFDQILRHGYAHHIQRLMVTGLFSLLYGASPRQMHDWHMSMYVDAWEWVSAPNVIGMSQYADGGLLGSKPYCASGKYIQRMSNYCGHCPLDPGEATGETACGLTTLYWDFLMRHEEAFRDNRRMTFQLAHIERKSAPQREAIQQQAERLRSSLKNTSLNPKHTSSPPD